MKKGLVIGVLMAALTAGGVSAAGTPQLSIYWEHVANDVEPGVCLTRWTLTNNGAEALPADGWTMYYCQLSVNPLFAEGDPLHFERISASSHKVMPTEVFAGLQPGESKAFDIRYKGYILKESAGPEGAFIVLNDSAAPVTVPITWAKFTSPKQWSRGIDSWYKYADGELLYDKFAPFTSGNVPQEPVFFLPRPKVVEWAVRRYIKPGESNGATHPEGYVIDISYGKIKVQAADEAGKYYAGKTLARLREAGLPNCHIEDWPDYPYRGFMLDIARNFTKKSDIMRLIDQMSDYKLNVLHLHLVDDEAWRLEIPGIPELTEIGSRRGYTTDETNCLYPYYGGGWDAEDPANPANGYLTKEDFKDILTYAQAHHIRVIPEIDIPGHSRAAIKCMEARYHKYKTEDVRKAYQYLLTDFSRSKQDYNSAQSYKDNVIAINLPSSLDFMEKVISEIRIMYEEAGVEQTWFHLGGDEVAQGVYTDAEHALFLQELRKTISGNGFQPAGWEEIAAVLPEMQPLSYCWKVSQKKAQELSEQGFPVVLSCANVLYFDHVYVRHQQERGLYWAGSCELMDTYLFEPIRGENVQGLQAQVFAETLRGNYAQVEQYIFPRLFALSERAWNARAESAAKYQNRAITPAEWNAAICKFELPRIHKQGITFHLSQPGIHVDKGQATIISSVPGAVIRYTLDGSEPTAASERYTAPVRVKKDMIIRAKAFFLDTESYTTWWLPSDEKAKNKSKTTEYSGATY